MPESRVSALARIDAALARMEAALTNIPGRQTDAPDAEQRLDRLKAEVAGVIGELDQLLGRDAEGRP